MTIDTYKTVNLLKDTFALLRDFIIFIILLLLIIFSNAAK